MKSKCLVRMLTIVILLTVGLMLSGSVVWAEEIEIKMVPMNYYPTDQPRKIGAVELPKIGAIIDLAREWEGMHPEVKITFVQQPFGGYDTWLNTQLLGGMAPDIVFSAGASLLGEKGLMVKLNSYLDMPNPYIPGNERWKNIFYEQAYAIDAAPDGSIYSIAPDLVETTIFYNKNIFNEVGVEPPNTWAEMMTIGKKIQEAKYNAIALGEGPLAWWGLALIGDMIMDPLIEKLDVITKNGRVETEEYARGIKKDIFSAKNPLYQECWKIYKDWTDIWPRGWANSDTYRLFVTGKLAMYWRHAQFYSVIKYDPLKAFEFGTFYLPKITKETSSLATGVLPKQVGGPANLYGITICAEERVTVDLCVDWLMFLTTPENCEKLVNEAMMFIPSVKAAKADPELLALLDVLDRGRPRISMDPRLNAQSRTNLLRYAMMFLLGRTDMDKFIDQVQKLFEKTVEDLIRADEWDTSKW